MEWKNLYSVGRITKIHGIKGAVVLRGTVELSRLLKNQEVLFLDFDGCFIPFFPEECEFPAEDFAIIQFRDIGSPVKPGELPGKEVFILLSKSRKKAGISLHDLEGYQVWDKETGFLGTVKGVMDFDLNPLIRVVKENLEILVPFTEPIIQHVDHREKTLRVELPKGLIDVYKGERE